MDLQCQPAELVVHLLKRMQFPVIGLTFCSHPGVLTLVEDAANLPARVDEADVSDLDLLRVAPHALDLGHLLVHPELAVAEVVDEHLVLDCAAFVSAVAEEAEAVCHLPECGRLLLPRHLPHLIHIMKREIQRYHGLLHLPLHWHQTEIILSLGMNIVLLEPLMIFHLLALVIETDMVPLHVDLVLDDGFDVRDRAAWVGGHLPHTVDFELFESNP